VNEGALLVRPDGFTAWRTRAMIDQPAVELLRVLAEVLAIPEKTLLS
jgi:hypothetical protein